MTDWSKDMLVAFRDLYQQRPELSFDKIATQMSNAFDVTLTRNACIGKSHRLGLPQRGHRTGPRKPYPHPKEKVIKMKRVKLDAPITLPLTPREPVPFTALIYDLEQGICHWPSGTLYDRPPFFYCGEPAVIGRPYCDAHMKRSVSNWAKAS
jgi:hypothetical protein